MKKFLTRVLCYLLGFGLLLAGTSAAIDPFNVLHPLSIRDNGPGFEAETLAALEEQMREIQRTGTLPSLKINGMGILHVYIRFRLLYDEFCFRLENNPEGGACVTIGAKTNEQSV